jgi:hypothetical protein
VSESRATSPPGHREGPWRDLPTDRPLWPGTEPVRAPDRNTSSRYDDARLRFSDPRVGRLDVSLAAVADISVRPRSDGAAVRLTFEVEVPLGGNSLVDSSGRAMDADQLQRAWRTARAAASDDVAAAPADPPTVPGDAGPAAGAHRVQSRDAGPPRTTVYNDVPAVLVEGPSPPTTATAALDGGPEPPAEVPAEDARKPIAGPALVPDGPEWLMLAPLEDTRRLAQAQLLWFDEPH